MSYFAECREFYRQFRTQYFTTGSILPSSRALGRALAANLRKSGPARRVVEIGPGTGAVTAEIVRKLRPGDTLDLIEINPNFVRILEHRLANEPLFQQRRHQIRILNAPVQDVPGEHLYDFMISGLPLNNFPLALVRDIFRSYQRLLKPGGVLSYFEYIWIRNAKMLFVAKRQRQRLHVLGRFLDRRLRAYEIGSERVYFNVPPAVARHLRFTKNR